MKGGSRETKGQKRTGGRRTGYGRREIVTPLSPPPPPLTKEPDLQKGPYIQINFLSALTLVDSARADSSE